MTYKGSNWTRGELGHAGPDPNAPIPCADCGQNFRFEDYWEPRVIDGDRVDEPHEEPWRCDDCHEIHQRKQANQRIDKWAKEAV